MHLRSFTHDTDSAADSHLGPKARQIVDAVLGAICTNRLSPGLKLGEAQLATIFGTSRTVVRQALQQLAFFDLVRLEPNRGAFVAKATPREARDLYAARRAIEAETIAELARHCTANDIRTLRRHIDFEREAERTGARWDMIRLRSDFHLEIARLSGNEVLHDLLARILPRTAMIAACYRAQRLACHPTDEHAGLIDLLAAGKVDTCVQFMRAHLELDETRLSFPAKPGIPNEDLATALASAAQPNPGYPTLAQASVADGPLSHDGL